MPTMQDDSRSIHFVSVEFRNYKAFQRHSLRLQRTNILVGPNNAGKSTIVGAFRALAVALRRTRSKKPDIVEGPEGRRYGYKVPGENLPITIENIHNDYAESDTSVIFRLSNRNELHLYFPTDGTCTLLAEAHNVPLTTTTAWWKAFPVSVSVVPVLGPVEHREPILQLETVQRDLMTHRASRHFRNYWYQLPDGFEDFARLVAQTWPGVEIQPPEITEKMDPFLSMFCLENRLTRELYWAGSGFQIWCQLLTHILLGKNASLLVVDEPEVYLHADLQRQLVGILRSMGPDILIATHSTEIMTEADPSEVLLVNKKKLKSERLMTAEKLQDALIQVGSIQTNVLARLSRSKKVLFVEDENDFKVLRWFAGRLGFDHLASGLDITPVKSDGFSSWKKISALGWGLEKVLDEKLMIGVIYDRDYFCREEIEEVREALEKTAQLVHIHSRKELENYLLQEGALARAVQASIYEKHTDDQKSEEEISQNVISLLEEITATHRDDAQSQYIGKRVDHLRNTSVNSATLTKQTLLDFSTRWENLDARFAIVPGKKVLSEFRQRISVLYGVTITDHRIISSFGRDEIAADLKTLISNLEAFRISND